MARDKTRRDRSNERKLAHRASKAERQAERDRLVFQRNFTAQLSKIASSGKAKITVNEYE